MPNELDFSANAKNVNVKNIGRRIPLKNTGTTEQLKAGMVIIGGGGSGLVAAVRAAEAGVKNIIVLEKNKRAGGYAISAGGMMAYDSPAQRRLGIKIDKDETFKEKMARVNWQVNARLIRNVINTSGNVIGWFESKGIRFDDIIQFAAAGEAPRVFHKINGTPQGRAGQPIMQAMMKDCEKHNIRIFLKTPATRILTNKEGHITGVRATGENGTFDISTDCVVVTAGEFGPNPEMVKKFFPSVRDPESHMNPTHQGDGIKMADEAGAWIEDVVAKHMFPMTASHRLGVFLLRPETIWVNKNGVRFIDEALPIHHMESAVNQLMLQPGHTGFIVFDTGIVKQILSKREVLSGQEKDTGENGKWFDVMEENLKQEGDEGDGIAVPQPMVPPPGMSEEEGGPPPGFLNSPKKTTKRANTWEGIADFMGVKPEVLKTTIKQYNEYCAAAYDADFVKEARYLLPLQEPPFYATVVNQCFHSTMGGIRVSHLMEVISKQSTLIPGLYAAGDNANSFVYADYDFRYPGTSLGFALISGYIAGDSAAAYVKGKR